LGWQAEGVERWGPYVEVAERIAPMAAHWRMNAQEFDDWHLFDLVYYYGLAPEQGRDERIKRHIADRMKPGALLFCARRPFPTWLDHIDGLIWRIP
jgi:hypothetical protein